MEFKRGLETITLNKTKNKDGSESWHNAASKQIDAMKVEDLLAKFQPAGRVVRRWIECGTQESGAGRDGPLRRQQDGAGFTARAGGDVLASRSTSGTAKLTAASFDEVFKESMKQVN